MMTILNALRTSAQKIGDVNVAAQTALPTPANQADAVSLFFREKAFWTFGRGQRLSDLRRLVRQYKRTADQVFPTGTYFKGGVPYGTDVNLPVTDNERTNPNFHGCTDRNA
jgi:starch-binding outer membrane protein, SusD/RagB family